MSDMLKIGVLASGRGTNLQSIIDSIESGKLAAEIKVIVSDRENAGALIRADKYQITNHYLDLGKYLSRLEFEEELIDLLEKYNVELVVMAGFMRVLTPHFINHYRQRIMNIHPSLLPAFPGLNAQKQALEYGVKVTGCTVHFADEGMDTGPIILQAAVPVKENDTVESLSRRILKEEHKKYPEAIKLYSQGRIVISDGIVKIKNCVG